MSISDIPNMVTQIYKICSGVKQAIETANKLEEDYRNIEAVVDNLYAMVVRIKKTEKMMENPDIGLAVQGLMKRLEEAQITKVDDDQEGQNVLRRLARLLKAKDEAHKLNQVESKINQAIQNLHLAISLYSDSTVTKIHEGQLELLKASQAIHSLSNNLVAAMTKSMQVFAATFQMHHELTLPEGPGGETTGNVIRTLGSSDISNNNNLPELYPLVLRFPLEVGRETRDSECPISLVNKTGNHVGVLIQQTEPTYYRFETCIIMVPHSTLATSIEWNSDTRRQPGSWAKLEARIIEVWSHNAVEHLLQNFIDGNRGSIHNWEQKVKSNKAKIHTKKLTAVACELETNEVLSKFKVEPNIRSIDVHPTAPRILITHTNGHLTIWDYQREKQLVDIDNKKGIKFVSAKYICQHGKDWMAVGDNNGSIHVYDCTALAMDKVKEFQAYNGKSVDSLAVHPTKSWLLSSSSDDETIKLWDFKNDGADPIREFKDDKTKPGVWYLTFNPRDPNTFACVTNKNDSYAMVWNIESSKPSKTLPRVRHAEFVFSQSNPQFLVTLGVFNEEGFQIWNLQTANEPVHTLNVWFDRTLTVASHPTIPMLATYSKLTGAVCLWDASTYRLNRKVYMESNREDVKLLFASIGGLPRLVVAWKNNIEVLDAAPIERPGQDQALADAYLTIDSMSEQAGDGVVSSNRQRHNTGNNGGVHVHHHPPPSGPFPSLFPKPEERKDLRPSTYSYSPESSRMALSPWTLSIPSRSRSNQNRPLVVNAQQQFSTLQHGANNNLASRHWAQQLQGPPPPQWPVPQHYSQLKNVPPQHAIPTEQHYSASPIPTEQHYSQVMNVPPQHANYVAQQQATTTMVPSDNHGDVAQLQASLPRVPRRRLAPRRPTTSALSNGTQPNDAANMEPSDEHNEAPPDASPSTCPQAVTYDLNAGEHPEHQEPLGHGRGRA